MRDGSGGESGEVGANQHSVWLVTELSVNAATPREAHECGQDWLTQALEAQAVPSIPPEEGLNSMVTVVQAVKGLTDTSWPALQMLALEERGEEDAAWMRDIYRQMNERLAKEESRHL